MKFVRLTETERPGLTSITIQLSYKRNPNVHLACSQRIERHD